MLPRVASSSSAKGAAAASLDYYGEGEEDGSFHQFHAHQVQLGSSRKESKAPPCWVVHNSPSMGNKVDLLWQTTSWLRSFEEQSEEDEPIWWPLICPLTDGSDAALLALAWQLMAALGWTIAVRTPLVCLPAPTIMNIGQFLNEDTMGHGWSMEQWLGTYAHALQCIGEAVEGRCWRPEGEGFAPKVFPLVEAFIGMMGARDAKDCAVDCWSEPPGNIPCQSDTGTYTNVIFYLDELATRWPSRKAWQKLVLLPSIFCSPHAVPG